MLLIIFSYKIYNDIIVCFYDRTKIEDIIAKNASRASSSEPLLAEIQRNPPKDSSSLIDFMNKVETELGMSSAIEEEVKFCSPCRLSKHRDDERLENESVDGVDCEDEDESVEDDDCDDEEIETGGASNKRGRRSNEDLKYDALLAPFADICANLAVSCSAKCCFKRTCTQTIPMQVIFSERIKFFNPIGEPAPNDREKAAKTLDYFEHQMRRDHKENLSFKIGEHNLCLAGFARVIGFMSSTDISKAPGQFRRLLCGQLNGVDKLQLLADKTIKLDSKDKFTEIKGFQEAFISDIAMYFSDTLPTVKSLNASTETKQLPYKYVKDLYDEMTYQCLTANPPVSKSIYGSLSTFQKVYDKMHELGKIQLLGGKSGFETCSICNHCIALKQAAVGRRDRQTI